MWSQKVRDAVSLFMALAESKLAEVCELVAEFLSEYRYYILIGLIILGILVSLNLRMKWQDKREKKRIDAEIEKQMKEKMTHDKSDEGP
jgi:hypothetical protein